MRFPDLFQALQGSGVRYVLVGGLAANLHGVDRSTYDIDLVLAMDEANLSRFIEMAKSFKLVPNIPVPMDSLKSPSQIEQWHREKGMVVFSFRVPDEQAYAIDVLVKPVVSYEELVTEASTSKFMGQPVLIASKRHLIQLKSAAGRPKDRQDIELLAAMIAKENQSP